MAKREKSELEGFVLGLVWQFGPCSAYEIRKHLLTSPSTQWSGSAGAVYPLVRRLARQGLLVGSKGRTGKRPRTTYQVSPKGLKELRGWIGPPLMEAAISVPHDPLRSRARFLAALSASERKRWIDAAALALEAVEGSVREWHALYGEVGDPFLAAMTEQAETDLRTRRQWLAKLRGMA
jgi:DNA-binding PadR family transcriptional regulator